MTITAQTNYTAKHHHHLIPGIPGRAEGGPVFERRSPVDGRLVATVTRGTRADTEEAIRIAREEFDNGAWPRISGVDRTKTLLAWARCVEAHFEEVAAIEVAEVGKPIRFARGDVRETIDLIERAAYAGSELHGDSFDDLGGSTLAIVRREPVGVVGAIIPWNSPAIIFAQKVAPALAVGCTVVAKPSELTTGSALLLARLAYEAGVPETALLVVTGSGREVGAPLAESTDVDILSFTGSTATANVLTTVSRPYPQRQHMELGGKGASIVFTDADLDSAADGVLFSFNVNSGETCTSGARLLVQRGVADEFIERLKGAASHLVVGDPWSEDTDLGPLIHAEHKRSVLARLTRAADEGAEVIPLEVANSIPETGEYVVPTIVRGASVFSDIFCEETFGPTLTIVEFDDADEAVALTNATMYGLANSIWTADVSLALDMSRRINSGMIWINDTMAAKPVLPFGGNKGSGYGRAKSSHGVEEFTQLKAITVRIDKPARHYRGN